MQYSARSTVLNVVNVVCVGQQARWPLFYVCEVVWEPTGYRPAESIAFGAVSRMTLCLLQLGASFSACSLANVRRPAKRCEVALLLVYVFKFSFLLMLY